MWMSSDKTRVLVIAPHPDDEVLGCGGTIARHVQNGDEVHVVVVTRGIPELFPAEVIEGTRGELRRAHDMLGVSTTQFLDYPCPKTDTVPGCELADTIGRVIRSLAASVVYLPHRGDLHVDHRTVYLAGLVASRPVNGCPVRRLLSYETPSETEWAFPAGDDAFVPTVFVDISDQLEVKIRAMECYQSQLKPFPTLRSLEAIEALARWRGATVGLAAAEAFSLVREVSQ